MYFVLCVPNVNNLMSAYKKYHLTKTFCFIQNGNKKQVFFYIDSDSDEVLPQNKSLFDIFS